MTFFYDNQPKKWNNKCPKCKSNIRWSLKAARAGSSAVAICANNLSASRLNIKSLRDIKVCFWKGTAIRQTDGGIRFRNLDNSWISEQTT